MLYPDLYVNSLLDIPLGQLQEKNIKAFILDLDNTITEWNSNDIREEIGTWFASIRSQGFKACILSNNGEERVLQVAESLGIPFISRAQKPRRGGFHRAVSLMGVKPEETAVIGDQISPMFWAAIEPDCILFWWFPSPGESSWEPSFHVLWNILSYVVCNGGGTGNKPTGLRHAGHS